MELEGKSTFSQPGRIVNSIGRPSVKDMPAGAVALAAMKVGLGKADPSVVSERLAVCQSCEYRVTFVPRGSPPETAGKDYCSCCWCSIESKTAWKHKGCPMAKWFALTKDGQPIPSKPKGCRKLATQTPQASNDGQA